MSIFIKIENWFKSAVTAIDADLAPGIKYIETNIPAIAVRIGEALLTAFEAGTPYATIGATLISTLESQGIKLAAGAAQVVLNTAENNLIAAGTPAPITVANTAATASATPLPSTAPAVVAAVAVAAASQTNSASA